MSNYLPETKATLSIETQQTEFSTISGTYEVSLFGVSRWNRPKIAHHQVLDRVLIAG